MKITKQQLRRIIKEELLREWQPGMDPDPGGQEVRDQVGQYQSTFNSDNYGWNDEAYDAAIAAGPIGLAQWISEQTDSYLYHLVDGGIWSGLAKNYRFDPQEVADELCRLKPGAWKDYKDEICFRK